MPVTYPAAVKSARMSAVVTQIGTTGVLEIGTTATGPRLGDMVATEAGSDVFRASYASDYTWDTTQGKAGAFNTRRYNELLRDDVLATELIVTLVTQGFFDGNAQRLFGGR